MISIAPNAVAIVAPVEYPAADAVDCMQLFSRIDILDSRPPVNVRSAFQITKDITHDVMATPNDQPTLRVVYRFDTDISMPRIAPMATARNVSCGTCSPM